MHAGEVEGRPRARITKTVDTMTETGALVSLPDKVMEIVTMGEGGSDVARTIVIAYLSEKECLGGEKVE